MAYPARLTTLLTVWSLLLTTAEANQRISCTAGSFVLHRDASVTCQFNENLRTAKKNFNIVQYPFTRKGGSNSDSGTYVLVCNWKQSTSDYECKTEDGFTFNKAVSETVVLGIPAVSASSGGVYVCQVVPDNGVPLETCTLNVKEPEQCPKCECSCSQAEILGVCLTILVILLLALLFFGFRYTRKRFYLEKRVGNPQQDKCICCGFAFNVRRKPKSTHTVTMSRAQCNAVTFTNEGEKEKLLDQGNLPEPVFTIHTGTQGLQSTSRPSANVKVNVQEDDDADNQPRVERQQQQQQQQQQAHAAAVAASSSRDWLEEEEVDNDKFRTTNDDENNAEGDALAESFEQESEPMKALGYEKWTTDQVCQWLTREKASSTLIGALQEHRVTGEMLAEVSFSKIGGNVKNKMKGFGITEESAHKELKEKIKHLRHVEKEEHEAETVAAKKAKKDAKESKKKKK